MNILFNFWQWNTHIFEYFFLFFPSAFWFNRYLFFLRFLFERRIKGWTWTKSNDEKSTILFFQPRVITFWCRMDWAELSWAELNWTELKAQTIDEIRIILMRIFSTICVRKAYKCGISFAWSIRVSTWACVCMCIWECVRLRMHFRLFHTHCMWMWMCMIAFTNVFFFFLLFKPTDIQYIHNIWRAIVCV